jgi:hypothetical protein
MEYKSNPPGNPLFRNVVQHADFRVVADEEGASPVALALAEHGALGGAFITAEISTRDLADMGIIQPEALAEARRLLRDADACRGDASGAKGAGVRSWLAEQHVAFKRKIRFTCNW